MAELIISHSSVDSEASGILLAALNTGYTPIVGPEAAGLEFPPEPAALSMATLAIATEGGPIAHEIVGGFDVHDDPPRRKMVAMYEAATSWSQMFKPGTAEAALMKWFCVEATLRANKKLIAAHVIARTLRTNELIDAVMFPPELSDEVPAMIRQMAAAEVKMPVDEMPSEALSEVAEMKPSMASTTTQLAVITALPSKDGFRSLAREYYRARRR